MPSISFLRSWNESWWKMSFFPRRIFLFPPTAYSCWHCITNCLPILTPHPHHQGCQMVCFQTKNTNLGKFRRALDREMLIYFMAIWNILRTFGIIYDHVVQVVFIWYIFPVLVSCTNKNLATLPITPTQPNRVTRLGEFLFAHWVIVYFGQFCENYRRSSHFWALISLCIIFDKNGLG
jgi:hypothetical protein